MRSRARSWDKRRVDAERRGIARVSAEWVSALCRWLGSALNHGQPALTRLPLPIEKIELRADPHFTDHRDARGQPGPLIRHTRFSRLEAHMRRHSRINGDLAEHLVQCLP